MLERGPSVESGNQSRRLCCASARGHGAPGRRVFNRPRTRVRSSADVGAVDVDNENQLREITTENVVSRCALG